MTAGENMLARLVPKAQSGRSERAYLEASAEILDAIEALTSEVIGLREVIEEARTDGIPPSIRMIEDVKLVDVSITKDGLEGTYVIPSSSFGPDPRRASGKGNDVVNPYPSDPVPTLPDPGRDVPVKRGPGRPRKATT